VSTDPPRDGTLQGAGLRLHYLDWGGAGSRALLFLHGGGLTAHTWDAVCGALRQEHRCVALDLRGHGDSEWSADGAYALDDHAADVAATLEHLGLGRFVLVGMSLGAAAALTYAGRHAGDLAALVLVEGGPELRPAGGARIREFMSGPAEAASMEEFVDRAAAFNPLRSRESLRRSLAHSLRRTPEGRWTWKYDRRILERAPGTEAVAQRQALWDAARAVACPTLIVRGGESEAFLDEDAAALASAMPDARWVRIDGAGHTVQGDRPVELVRAIRDFLAGARIMRP
jgi:pimeloyl-ACP methyl ester carboxylesterase